MSVVTVPSTAAARPAVRSSRRSPLQGLRTPRGIAGLALVVLVVLLGLIPPLFMKWGPLDQTALPLAPAGTGSHLLGTDEVGRDILARVLAGIRLDTVLVLIAVPISCVVGTGLGMLVALNVRAGNAAQWIFNVILGFPGVVLGIVVTIPFQPGRTAVLIAAVLSTIPLFGRQARVTTLTQLSRDYVAAAIVSGTPRPEIMLRHILPNVLDSVIVRITPAVSGVILLEGALSVVGLGIQPPQSSLGQMIAGGSQYLSSLPMYSLAPVIVLFVAVLGLSLIGDALNEAMLRS
jgi:peptide/nickel transport system permease protein